MKKIVSIIMAVIFVLTSLSCTTALAASTTPDESDNNFEGGYLERQIIYKLSEREHQSTDDIVLTSFYQLSDTSAIYSYAVKGRETISYPEQTVIGSYKYFYNGIDKVYYFADSKIYTLNSAYSSGILSDEQLDKIAEILELPKVSEDDVFLKIREQIKEKYSYLNPNDITFFDVHYLNSNDVLFGYRIEGTGSPCVMNEYYIGKYRYFVDCAAESFIYVNSEVTHIADAYNNGLIDDAELDEIAAELGFEAVVEDDVISEIKEKIADDKNCKPKDIVIFGVDILDNGSVLFSYRIKNIDLPTVMMEYNIGQYRYYSSAWQERFIYCDSKIYNIKAAYTEGVINDVGLDEIARVLSKYFSLYSDSPDINDDGKVDVDDVTLIQKQLAGLTETVPDSFAVTDIDSDCSLTINDVTAIQKQIAGLEV